MPSYLVDGVVVLAVSGVLFAVFVACLVHSAVVEKRRRHTTNHRQQHGRQKLVVDEQ